MKLSPFFKRKVCFCCHLIGLTGITVAIMYSVKIGFNFSSVLYRDKGLPLGWKLLMCRHGGKPIYIHKCIPISACPVVKTGGIDSVTENPVQLPLVLSHNRLLGNTCE